MKAIVNFLNAKRTAYEENYFGSITDGILPQIIKELFTMFLTKKLIFLFNN